VLLVRQKLIIRMDGYTTEAYLCHGVEISWTDSPDHLLLQDTLACLIKQVLIYYENE
jgi:hypothetical protein